MRKKEIIKTMIDYYIKCGKELPLRNWREYASVHHLEYGVCNASKRVTGEQVNFTSWVHYWCGFSDCVTFHWTATLMHQFFPTRKWFLKSLETRIFILSMELESGIE